MSTWLLWSMVAGSFALGAWGGPTPWRVADDPMSWGVWRSVGEGCIEAQMRTYSGRVLERGEPVCGVKAHDSEPAR